MQGSVHDDAIFTRLVGNIIGHQDLRRIQDTREGQRIGRAVGEAEVYPVARDLSVVHSPEAQGLGHPHQRGYLPDLLVNPAVSVEQIDSWFVLIEHCFPDIIVTSLPFEALFGAVVDAGGP